MGTLQPKILALVLAMAIAAATGLAFVASAEERFLPRGDVASSSSSTVQGSGDVGAAVELPWRRVLRRRAKSAYGGGGGGGDLAWWRRNIPPSGPSSRGHVDAVTPEEEIKEREEGAGSRSTKLDPSSAP